MFHERVGFTYIADRLGTGGNAIKSELDHCYVSSKEALQDIKVVDNALSDHFPLILGLSLKKESKKVRKLITFRKLQHIDMTSFCYDLSLKPWECLGETECPHKAATMFAEFVLETLDRHAPERNKSIKVNKKLKIKIK